MTLEKINLLILVTIVVAFKAITLPINGDREFSSENSRNIPTTIHRTSHLDL